MADHFVRELLHTAFAFMDALSSLIESFEGEEPWPGEETGEVLIEMAAGSITETPPVEAALEELRRDLGTDRVDLGELVILGARAKLAAIRAERDDEEQRLQRLADRVRAGTLDVDVEAAAEARRSWVRS